MLSYLEINEILKKFDANLYNKFQVGSDKKLILSIYEFLNHLNLSKEIIEPLMKHIAYLNIKEIDLVFYLEILSKSLGFINKYSLKEVLDTLKLVHDVYKRENSFSLEEYLHEIPENRMRRLFLDRNGKYLEKYFNNECLVFISDLKLSAAITLGQKEYNEFICYIDDFKKYQGTYSPFKLFRTYFKVRRKLSRESCLFWDIIYGIEYILSLYKSNIDLKEIYKENVFIKEDYRRKANNKIVQLDLFTYQDTDSYLRVNEDIKGFQLCTLYNSKEVPSFKQETELIEYYNKLIKKGKKNVIVLPKLKNQVRTSYHLEIN